MYGDWLSDKGQEIVRQILINQDGLIRNIVPRQSDMWTFNKIRSYVFNESGEDVFRDIFKNKLIVPGSERMSVDKRCDLNGRDPHT